MHQLFRFRRALPFFFVCFSAVLLRSQQTLPTSELRGVWIATVVNIDWPSAPGLSSGRQQMEFDSLLDVLKAMGMNAVFVQIRPSGDALYPSAVVPWSKYLTGKQGVAPEPFYDPLEYMIKAAHNRHMEFHAWMNPYRASFDLDTAALAPTHPLRALPDNRKAEWFFRYGNRYYFNPASALVRQHLLNVVKEVVVRYDIDGIHFDDYFYPYKEPNQALQDYNDFAADPRGFAHIEDWRRDNVNKLIEGVSKMIKSIKPYVRFGVSPFGVWRNADQDPANGSQTRAGITCYDDLYADVLKWMQNGWIDYVAPQLYWSIGFAPADYEVLLDWWSKHTYGKQLYAGHAAYKINNFPNDPNWTKPDEISRQVALDRANPQVHGSIFYSAKPLLRNPLGVQDSMISRLYTNQAHTPGMPWLSKAPPATPQICRVSGSPSSVKLAWNACDVGIRDEMPYYFAIYRFDGQSVGDFQNPRSLLAFTPFYTEKWIFEDPTAAANEYYTYVVIGYNRLNVESYSSDPVVVKKTKKGAKKKRKFFGFLF